MLFEVARLYFFVFGVLTAVGGIIGFVKAKSRPSLIAGVGSGVLLLIAGALIGSGHLTAGLVAGAVLSLALAGRFVPAFRKGGKFMPAGLIALLSIGGLVLAVATLIVAR